MTAPDPELVEYLARAAVGWFELAGASSPKVVAQRLHNQQRGYTGTGPDGLFRSWWCDAKGFEVYLGSFGVDPIKVGHLPVAKWAFGRLTMDEHADLADLCAARGRAIGALWGHPLHRKRWQRPNDTTTEERAVLAVFERDQHGAERAMRQLVADAYTREVVAPGTQLDLFANLFV